jgi:hypothetical protein
MRCMTPIALSRDVMGRSFMSVQPTSGPAASRPSFGDTCRSAYPKIVEATLRRQPDALGLAHAHLSCPAIRKTSRVIDEGLSHIVSSRTFRPTGSDKCSRVIQPTKKPVHRSRLLITGGSGRRIYTYDTVGDPIEEMVWMGGVSATTLRLNGRAVPMHCGSGVAANATAGYRTRGPCPWSP